MKHKLMMTMIVSALFCGCFTGCGKVAETEKYIVENQEYVYSTYGDTGQLGEDGNYYNSDYPGKDAYEVPIFETTADLTHDGIADLVSVVGYGSEPDEAVDDVISNSSYGCYVKVYRGTKDGEYEESSAVYQPKLSPVTCRQWNNMSFKKRWSGLSAYNA